MTATLTALPTLEDRIRERADLDRDIARKQERLDEIAAERIAARRAGDASAVLRLEVQAEDLAGEIHKLEARRPQLVEWERAASEAVVRERQQRELADAQADQGWRWQEVLAALHALAKACGRYRAATERIAAVIEVQTGSHERARQEVYAHSGGGFLEASGAELGSWLARELRTGWPDELIERRTDELGKLLLVVWRHFAAGREHTGG